MLSSRPQSENERNRADRYILESCQRAEPSVEYESDGDANGSRSTWNGPQRLEKETDGFWNQRKNQYHSEHYIIKVGYNTQRSPGNLGRLAVT